MSDESDALNNSGPTGRPLGAGGQLADRRLADGGGSASDGVGDGALNGTHEVGAVSDYELNVSGMTCGSCSARVQGALGREPGVLDAVVNLATGRASVEAEAGTVSSERLVELSRGSATARLPFRAAPARRRWPLRRSNRTSDTSGRPG